MIKIKSFPLRKHEDANEFLLTHPSRSTEKQSGIVFHNGRIVIIYDDGIENPEDLKGKVRGEIDGDRSKLMLIQHSLEQAKSALREENLELASRSPEGYEHGMKDEQIRLLLKKDASVSGIDMTHVDNVMLQNFKDYVAPIEQRITNLENEILMDEHEVKRITNSIIGWEKLL